MTLENLPQDCVVYYLCEDIINAAAVRARIKKIDERIKKAKNDMLLLNAAQEALTAIEVLLRRMRVIAEAAALDDPPLERRILDKRFQSLKDEIRDIIDRAECDGVKLGNQGDIDDIIAGLDKALSISD